jgi:predicted ATP-binding protein involved in virulence
MVLSIAGRVLPLGKLSAGQRMMMAMVADIAIQAIMQNNFLVREETSLLDDESPPRVLTQISGVVLIDELDEHLHSKRQRGIGE